MTKTTEPTAMAIANSYLTRGINVDDLASLIDITREEQYESGEKLVCLGETGGDMMILVSGLGEVRSAIGDVLGLIKPGMIFGEVSVILNGPRIATVVALGPCKTVRIPREEFLTIIETHPTLGVKLMMNLAQALCLRLRSSTQQLSAMLALEGLHEDR